jgi:ribonuclease HII
MFCSAQVTRDRIMQQLHERFPVYNFSQHKGYPTFEHRSLLLTHGPSEVHRYSYRPVYEAAVARGVPIPAYVKAGPAAAAAPPPPPAPDAEPRGAKRGPAGGKAGRGKAGRGKQNTSKGAKKK